MIKIVPIDFQFMILALHKLGWDDREIAKAVGCSRTSIVYYKQGRMPLHDKGERIRVLYEMETAMKNVITVFGDGDINAHAQADSGLHRRSPCPA